MRATSPKPGVFAVECHNAVRDKFGVDRVAVRQAFQQVADSSASAVQREPSASVLNAQKRLPPHTLGRQCRAMRCRQRPWAAPPRLPAGGVACRAGRQLLGPSTRYEGGVRLREGPLRGGRRRQADQTGNDRHGASGRRTRAQLVAAAATPTRCAGRSPGGSCGGRPQGGRRRGCRQPHYHMYPSIE